MDGRDDALAGELQGFADGLHHLLLADGRRAVLKRRAAAPPGFFMAEAYGLAALRDAHALRTPTVYGRAGDWILLEDLGQGRPGGRYWEYAGEGLARQHLRASNRFGFAHDGWCGETPQRNAQTEDGHAFFADCRLRPQVAMARDRGLLDAGDARRAERIVERLDRLLPPAPPVLLHGDLWLGNLHCCGDGAPALIDAAAVHYGWAEADLAMLVLFGEPPAAFFAAYVATAPLDAGWRERAPLMNLYHLLNHLNLFGGGYLASVRRVLDRYS